MRRVRKFSVPALLLVLTLPMACARGDSTGADGGLSIPFERYQLPNGLTVILHEDHSDPVAAVTMTFHVGSAREVEGRTGFAHLFEHLFFLDSENLGPGGLDRLMTRIGSSTNGGTSRDFTSYYEVVPVDGLEKAIWAESDKLGFFINTVTEDVVDKERQVVKNEKRQGVDNNPYGHASYVIDRALYPEGHPYRWQVIGSLEDLDAAALADVKEFHTRWYGPNNATLSIAGDLDVAATKAWIEKYFGEIPSRPLPPATPRPARADLLAPVRLRHEDNFARLPQLQIAWPTVPSYHPDSYALDYLASILTDGKNTPFYKVIVEGKELAPAVGASNQTQELAGRFTITVRAFPNTDLDSVFAAVDSAFARFEQEGAPQKELDRVKARTETAFYSSLSSVFGKALQLAQYEIFAHDAGFVSEDLRRTLAVTTDDVKRVYETYVRGREPVFVSFVPRGQADLAMVGSQPAEVVEEPIVQGAEDEVAIDDRASITKTASAIDRSVEPPYGNAPTRTVPTVWQDTLASGLRVLGIRDTEMPLVTVELRMRGGHLVEETGQIGVANLLAMGMTEGTATKTPAELEEAIDLLGAQISVSSGQESFVIRASTLARNFDSTMALVEEILLEPRYDTLQFQLARERVRNALVQQASDPNSIGADVFNRLLYGDHILGTDPLGSSEVLDAVTIADLRAYHDRALSPSVSAVHVAGDVDQSEVTAALQGLATRWTTAAPTFPEPPAWDPARAGLYFVDVPNSSQSVVAIGYLALKQTDEDYWPANVLNFRLGGGGFASDLLQMLRESKGYTYGIGSDFAGTNLPGPFEISTAVRSNVTFESLELIKQIVERHGPDFNDEDLEATKGFLLRANAGAFETLGNKLGLLSDMSSYSFPADYVLQRENYVRGFTIENARTLSQRYLDPKGMIWLVVGDARTQRGRLAPLGLGAPITLDREGRRAR